jgi:hypothetical protein
MDRQHSEEQEKQSSHFSDSSAAVADKELGLFAVNGDRDSAASHHKDDVTGKEIASPISDHSIEDAAAEQTDDLEATRTRSRTVSVRDVNTIPDGGSTAWLQVLGSFFLFFNSW